MSLFESGHSSGQISFAALLDGSPQPGQGSSLSLQELLNRIVVGGWPELLGASEDLARDWLDDYVSQIVEIDIPAMGHRRNPTALMRLLAALGRSVGQAAKLTELAKDVGGEAGPTAHETITGYLEALDRLKLLDDSAAWRPHMRSRTRLRTAPVRYFVDPSLGTTALGIGTRELRTDPEALGFHFEALVIRDLRIYAQPLRGRFLAGRQRPWWKPTATVHPPASGSSPVAAPAAADQTASMSSPSGRLVLDPLSVPSAC